MHNQLTSRMPATKAILILASMKDSRGIRSLGRMNHSVNTSYIAHLRRRDVLDGDGVAVEASMM